MNVSFYNLGCKVNFADISRISKQFEELGHSIVNFENQSDIVLVNTCTVTHRADADCRNIVRKALKTSPNAFVGVMGCYAQLKPHEIAKIAGVDAVIGTKEKFEVTKLIEKFEKNHQTQIFVSNLDDVPFHTSVSSDNTGRTRAVIKLQDGCNYNCTYCTIPLARGKSRSMDFEDIIPELKKLEENGYHEVILSGINLGDYKGKNGEKFLDVVRLIEESDLNLRFRISSIEPNLLKKEILDIIENSEKFCHHFHIPLQSGSQEILMRMKRRYKADYYKNLIFDIKSRMTDCALGIDVIVGFPGETDERFDETYNFLEALPFTYLHVFTYSERDNTPAATYKEKVPNEIRKERVKKLRELSERKRIEFDNSQVGKAKTIIPETFNKDNGLWKGWTDNYVNVNFPESEFLTHNPMKIKLDNIFESKVYGNLIESPLNFVGSNKRLSLNVIEI